MHYDYDRCLYTHACVFASSFSGTEILVLQVLVPLLSTPGSFVAFLQLNVMLILAESQVVRLENRGSTFWWEVMFVGALPGERQQ